MLGKGSIEDAKALQASFSRAKSPRRRGRTLRDDSRPYRPLQPTPPPRQYGQYGQYGQNATTTDQYRFASRDTYSVTPTQRSFPQERPLVPSPVYPSAPPAATQQYSYGHVARDEREGHESKRLRTGPAARDDDVVMSGTSSVRRGLAASRWNLDGAPQGTDSPKPERTYHRHTTYPAVPPPPPPALGRRDQSFERRGTAPPGGRIVQSGLSQGPGLDASRWAS
ncbi:hypothetical protein GGS26DRAFT_279855 [Hypomontagnella submonticulosa]|nr:hypothetical protein GGS26DRAFT_279855 [Hypomontagnella submonticulosa]